MNARTVGKPTALPVIWPDIDRLIGKFRLSSPVKSLWIYKEEQRSVQKQKSYAQLLKSLRAIINLQVSTLDQAHSSTSLLGFSKLSKHQSFALGVIFPLSFLRSLEDKKARKCPHCEKTYVSMPAYSMHIRTHNQGCKCPFCGKCFSRPWLLQGHIRTHTGMYLSLQLLY